MSAEQQTTCQTVQRSGHAFKVVASHADFWRDFEQGSWEPSTFALFDYFLTKDTVHLDVGAWIGPTLLYAAARSRLAIGFEPDPVAFRELARNVALNPQLAPIRIHECAIAARSGRLRIGSRSDPGDSMSSALFAREKEAWTADARRLEEFESEWPAGSPIFLKIDIEGGEYSLLPALSSFVRRHRPTIYLSLHADFFMAPYAGQGRGRQLLGEASLLLRWLRCWPVFRQYPFITSLSGEPLSRTMLVRRSAWRRAWAIVLSHQPPPAVQA